MPGTERRVAYYRGRVQGVGFRYTVNRIARRYQVTGYVRNLDDGRVELVAEGEAEQVKQFLNEVARTMSDFIGDCQENHAQASGEFADFGIQH